jgi:hypothetical protein
MNANPKKKGLRAETVDAPRAGLHKNPLQNSTKTLYHLNKKNSKECKKLHTIQASGGARATGRHQAVVSRGRKTKESGESVSRQTGTTQNGTGSNPNEAAWVKQ